MFRSNTIAVVVVAGFVPKVQVLRVEESRTRLDMERNKPSTDLVELAIRHDDKRFNFLGLSDLRIDSMYISGEFLVGDILWPR